MNLGELIVELSADSSELEKTLERAKKKAYEAAVSVEKSFENINLNVGVDDDSLVNLNKHLNLKVQHLKEVNKYFNNNPIVVNVDDSSLTDLNEHLNLKVQHLKQVNKYFDSNPIKVNTDTKSLDELEERLGGLSSRTITITVESDLSKQLEKSLADAVKNAVKEEMSEQASVTAQQQTAKEASSPNKVQKVDMVVNPGRAIMDGIFGGLGKGFTDGINRGIEDAVGVDIPTMTRITSNMMLRYFGVGKKAQSDPKNEQKRVEAILKDGIDAFVVAHDHRAAWYQGTSNSNAVGSTKRSRKKAYNPPKVANDVDVDFEATGQVAAKGLLRYFGIGKKAQSDPKNEQKRVEAILRGMVDDYVETQTPVKPSAASQFLTEINNQFVTEIEQSLENTAQRVKSATIGAVRKGSQNILANSSAKIQNAVNGVFNSLEGTGDGSGSLGGKIGSQIVSFAKQSVKSTTKTILPNTYGVVSEFLKTGTINTPKPKPIPVTPESELKQAASNLESATKGLNEYIANVSTVSTDSGLSQAAISLENAAQSLNNAVNTLNNSISAINLIAAPVVTQAIQSPVEQPLNIPVNIPRKSKKPQPELELVPIETTASQVPQQLKQHFETIKTNTLKNIDLSKQYVEATARENGEELVPLEIGKSKKSDEIKVQKEISLENVKASFKAINNYFSEEYKKLKIEVDQTKKTGTPAEIKATKEKLKKFILTSNSAIKDIDNIVKQAEDAGFDKKINSDLSKVHAGGKSPVSANAKRANEAIGKLNTEEKSIFDKQLAYYAPLAQQLGIDIDAGLAKGVKHGSDGVSDTARQMLDDLIETVEAKMKIQSPSLVMFEIGMMIASGLFLGMQKGNSKVAVGARQLVSTVKDAVGSAKEILEPALAVGGLIPGMSTAATYGSVGLAASDSGLKMLDKVGERHAANPEQTLFQSAFESGKDFVAELRADKTLTKPREAFDHFINLSKAGAATFGVSSFTAFDAAQSGMTALLRSGAIGKAVAQSHGETKTRLAKDPSLDYMAAYKAVLTEKLKDLKLTKPEIIKAIGSALKVVPTGFGTAANSVTETAGTVFADGIDALTIPRDLYRNIVTKAAKGATHQQAIAESITDLGAPTQVADAIGSFGDKHSVSLNAFARMSGNVVENINRSLINTVAASSKVVSASTNAVSNQVKKNMGHLPSQQPISKSDSRNVSSAAIASDNTSSKPFTSIGGNIMKGLGKGMADSIGSVTKVMDNAGNSIQSRIKQNMGISSPSKVMIALGLMIASGLAIGIKKGVIDVSSATDELTDMVINKMKSLQSLPSQNIEAFQEATLNASSPNSELTQKVYDESKGISKPTAFGSMIGTIMMGLANSGLTPKNIETPLRHLGAFYQGTAQVHKLNSALAREAEIATIFNMMQAAEKEGYLPDGGFVNMVKHENLPTLAHTLGGFNYTQTKDGGLQINDVYDWHNSEETDKNTPFSLPNNFGKKIYSMLDKNQWLVNLLGLESTDFGGSKAYSKYDTNTGRELFSFLNKEKHDFQLGHSVHSSVIGGSPYIQTHNLNKDEFDNLIDLATNPYLKSKSIKGNPNLKSFLEHPEISKYIKATQSSDEGGIKSLVSAVKKDFGEGSKFKKVFDNIFDPVSSQLNKQYEEYYQQLDQQEKSGDYKNRLVAEDIYDKLENPNNDMTKESVLSLISAHRMAGVRGDSDMQSRLHNILLNQFKANNPSIEGIGDKINKVKDLFGSEGIGDKINKVKDLFGSGFNFKEIGGNLISSFAQGFMSANGGVLGIVTKFAKGILSAVKKVFRIASPSGEGIDTGENYASSHAIGINNQAQTAVNAARNMAEDIRNAIADPYPNAQILSSKNFVLNPNAQIISSQKFTPKPDAQILFSRNFAPNLNAQIVSSQKFTPKPDAQLILPVVQGLSPAIRSTHSLEQNSISALIAANKQIQAIIAGNKVTVSSRFAPIPDPWTTPPLPTQAVKQLSKQMTGQYRPIPDFWLTSSRSTQAFKQAGKLPTGQIPITLSSTVPSFIPQPAGTATPKYVLPPQILGTTVPAYTVPVNPTPNTSSAPSISNNPNLNPVRPLPPTLLNQYLNLGTDLVTNIFNAVSTSIRQSTLSGYASLGQVMRNAVNAALFSLADTLKQPLHQALLSQTRSILPWFLKFIPRSFQLLPKLSFAIPFVGGMVLRFGNSIVKNLLENNILKEGGFLTNLLSSITRVDLSALSGTKTAGVTGFLKNIVSPVPLLVGSQFNPLLTLGISSASPFYDAFSGILGLDKSVKPNPKKQAPTIEKVLQDQTKINREKALLRDVKETGTSASVNAGVGQNLAAYPDAQRTKTEELLKRAVESGKAIPKLDELTRKALRERGVSSFVRNRMDSAELLTERENILKNPLNATSKERDFLLYTADMKKANAATLKEQEKRIISILKERGKSDQDIENIRNSGAYALLNVGDDLIKNLPTITKQPTATQTVQPRTSSASIASKELVENLGNTLLNSVLNNLDIPVIPKSVIQGMIGKKLRERSATIADAINAFGVEKSKAEQLLEKTVQSGRTDLGKRADGLTKQILRERGVTESVRNAMTPEQLAASREKITKSPIDLTARERKLLKFMGDFESHAATMGNDVATRKRDAMVMSVLQERGMSRAERKQIQQSQGGQGLSSFADNLRDNPRTGGFMGRLTEAYASNDQDAMKELVKQGLRKTGMSAKQVNNIDPKLLDTATAGLMTTLSGLQAKFREKGFDMGKALAKGLKDSMVNLANAKDDLEYNAKKVMGQANFGDSVGLIFRRMFRGTVATQGQFAEMYNQMGSGVKNLIFKDPKEGDEIFPNILQFVGSITTTLAPITTMIGAITPLLLPLAPIITGIGMAVNMVAPHVAKLIDGIQRVEVLQRRFKFLGGSKEGGKAEFNYAKDIATKLNVPSEVAANSYSQLAIAAKDSKMEGQGVKELFEGITSSLSALGINGQDASLVFMAYTQILAKGKLSMEELRQQLGEKFPPAMATFAKAMGVTIPEMNELVASGGILSQDILPKVAKVLKEDYGSAAADQAGGLVVALNRLGNVGFEITTIFTDKIGGTLAFFVNTFANILGVLSGALKEMIPLVQSFMIGFAATISIGLTIILSKFGPLRVAIGSLQSFLLATFSAITTNMMPMVVGIVSDVADGWLGAERNLLDNMFQGINNMIVTVFSTIDTAMRSMSDNKVSFSSLFGGLIQGAEQAGSIIDWLKGVFAGFFKILPSGIVEILAIVFMLEQGTGLMVMALWPAITKLWGGITGIFGATAKAFYGVMGTIKSVIELMMTSSAVASNATNNVAASGVRSTAIVQGALGFLSKALLHFGLAYAVLMFSKGDFSDPLRESINKSTADINKHLNQVRLNIGQTTEAFNKATKSVEKLGNTITDALPAKGVQLDIRSLWGGGDYKWDDAVRDTNAKYRPGSTGAIAGPSAMDVLGPVALGLGGAAVAYVTGAKIFATAITTAETTIAAIKAAQLAKAAISIPLMGRIAMAIAPMLASPIAPIALAVIGFAAAIGLATVALDAFAPKITEAQLNNTEEKGGLPEEIKQIINAKEVGERLDSASLQVIKLYKDQQLSNQRLKEFMASIGLDGKTPYSFVARPVVPMTQEQKEQFESETPVRNITKRIEDTKASLQGLENVGTTETEKSKARSKEGYKTVQEELTQLEKDKLLMQISFMANYDNKPRMNAIDKQIKDKEKEIADSYKDSRNFDYTYTTDGFGGASIGRNIKADELTKELEKLQKEKAVLQTNINASAKRRVNYDAIKKIDVDIEKTAAEFVEASNQLAVSPNDKLRNKAGLAKERIAQLQKRRQKLVDEFGDPTPAIKQMLEVTKREIEKTLSDSSILPQQRTVTVKELRKTQETLEKSLAEAEKFSIAPIADTMYTQAVAALKDNEVKSNVDISKNKIVSNQSQAKLYGTTLTSQQIAPGLSDRQIADLTFQQKVLERSLKIKEDSLKKLQIAAAGSPTNLSQIQEEITKLQQEIAKDKEQVSQNTLEIIKAQREARQALIDQTKQVAEYYRTSLRESQAATIEFDKATNNIKSQQFAIKLKQALVGAGNNIFTNFIDSVIGLFQQLTEIENLRLDRQKQKLDYENNIQDILIKVTEMQRSLPGKIVPFSLDQIRNFDKQLGTVNKSVSSINKEINNVANGIGVSAVNSTINLNKALQDLLKTLQDINKNPLNPAMQPFNNPSNPATQVPVNGSGDPNAILSIPQASLPTSTPVANATKEMLVAGLMSDMGMGYTPYSQVTKPKPKLPDNAFLSPIVGKSLSNIINTKYRHEDSFGKTGGIRFNQNIGVGKNTNIQSSVTGMATLIGNTLEIIKQTKGGTIKLIYEGLNIPSVKKNLKLNDGGSVNINAGQLIGNLAGNNFKFRTEINSSNMDPLKVVRDIEYKRLNAFQRVARFFDQPNEAVTNLGLLPEPKPVATSSTPSTPPVNRAINWVKGFIRENTPEPVKRVILNTKNFVNNVNVPKIDYADPRSGGLYGGVTGIIEFLLPGTGKKPTPTNSGKSGSGTNSGKSGSGTNPGKSGSGTNSGKSGSGTNPGKSGSGTNSGKSGSGTNPGKSGSGTNSGKSGSGTNSGKSGSGTNPGKSGSGTNPGTGGLTTVSNTGNQIPTNLSGAFPQSSRITLTNASTGGNTTTGQPKVIPQSQLPQIPRVALSVVIPPGTDPYTRSQLQNQPLNPDKFQPGVERSGKLSLEAKKKQAEAEAAKNKAEIQSKLVEFQRNLSNLLRDTNKGIRDESQQAAQDINNASEYIQGLLNPNASDKEKFATDFQKLKTEYQARINEQQNIIESTRAPLAELARVDDLIAAAQREGIDASGLKTLRDEVYRVVKTREQTAIALRKMYTDNKQKVFDVFTDRFKDRELNRKLERSAALLGVDISQLKLQLEELKGIQAIDPLNPELLKIPDLEANIADLELTQATQQKIVALLNEWQQSGGKNMSQEVFKKRAKDIMNTVTKQTGIIERKRRTDNTVAYVNRELGLIDKGAAEREPITKGLQLDNSLFAAKNKNGLVNIINFENEALIKQKELMDSYRKTSLETQRDFKLSSDERLRIESQNAMNLQKELNVLKIETEYQKATGEIKNRQVTVDVEVRLSDSAKAIFESKSTIKKNLGLELAGERLDRQNAITTQENEYKRKQNETSQFILDNNLTDSQAYVLRKNNEVENDLKLRTIKSQFSEFAQLIKSFVSGFKSSFKEFLLSTEDTGTALLNLAKGIGKSVLDTLAEIASKRVTDLLFGWMGGTGLSPASELSFAAQQLTQAAYALQNAGNGSIAGASGLEAGSFGGIDSFSSIGTEFLDPSTFAASDFGSASLSGFAKGGMIDKDTLGKIQNFANGGIVGTMNKERAMTGRTPHLVVASEGERILNHKETAIWNKLQSGISGFADGGIVGGGSGDIASKIGGSTTTVNVPVSVSVSEGSDVDGARLSQTVQALVSDGIRREMRPGGSIRRGNPYGR